MNKKTIISATIRKLKVLAKKKESVRSNLVVTAENLAATAKEKERIKHRLEVTAKQLAVTAKEKEGIRRRLVVTAENLATLAKEKEGIRRRLAVTAEELRLKAKELEQRTRELSTLIENLPVGVYLAKAPNGEPLMVNKIGIELLGKGVDPKANKNTYTEVYKIVKENGLSYPVKELPLNMTLATGKTVRKTDIYVGKGDVKTPIYVTSAPIKDSQGKLISAVAVYEDVTQEKALERSRDEFFSIASHELRTPLTAIRGNAALLKEYFADKMKDPTIQEIVKDISTSSTRLITLVNDFLDTSRLEQGRIQFQMGSFDIVPVIEEAVRELEPSAIGHKLTVEFRKPESPLPPVFADPARVRQILTNLIGNGLKFTEKGGVTTSVKQTDRNDWQNSMLEISVTDTGRGIAPENQSLLFQKFRQAPTKDFHTRDVTEGTGLGLYISKKLAEGMVGKIWLVKSEVGKGSTFAFSLPVAKKT